ncbi:MAG: hypothetical protein OEZ58_16170 [Gammaproteobacteria bacterium]|nr:hypothetical protein [Gammaproteobacteria bacterium]MDH5730528.1 hypothetical protein [Gammaproteobacteria bacterium]
MQSHSGQQIARRYFVVNGFDGALTMLGIVMGFYVNQSHDIQMAISACLGAAIALGVSGVTSAYISEQAERKLELSELQQAMIDDLSDSQHKKHARLIPFLVALVNGVSPLIISLLILCPLFFSTLLPDDSNPFLLCIGIAFIVLFFLGVFLGRISQTFWLWSGLRTLLIALFTSLLIFFINP